MVSGQLERSIHLVSVTARQKLSHTNGALCVAPNRPWCDSLWIVLAYFTDSCLHFFRGQRLCYIISGIQLPAISWMIFSSDFLRCDLCTLPFHIISWHFHPSTGNVSNFVWTHQNIYSSLSFLSLWYQRTFENNLNTKWMISLLFNKRDTSNSPEILCEWA